MCLLFLRSIFGRKFLYKGSQSHTYTSQTQKTPPSAEDIFGKIMQSVDTDEDGSISSQELSALNEDKQAKFSSKHRIYRDSKLHSCHTVTCFFCLIQCIIYLFKKSKNIFVSIGMGYTETTSYILNRFKIVFLNRQT